MSVVREGGEHKREVGQVADYCESCQDAVDPWPDRNAIKAVLVATARSA